MAWLISLLLSLLLAPLLPGVINKTKAWFAGRRGPRLLQLYWDIFRLLRKAPVRSLTATPLFTLAPAANLATLLLAALLLPCGMNPSPLGFAGDAVLFFYLLGSGRFLTILAAMDTGSAFEGMGASREAYFSALVEATIFAILCFLLTLTVRTDLSGMLASFGPEAWQESATPMLLGALAFIAVLLCENCRVPFDDPETHLELTMVHEAMILDHAGPELGLVLYASALKLWLLSGFFVLLLLPAIPGLPAHGHALIWIGGTLGSGILVGTIESSLARARFLKVPQLLLGAFAAALIALILLKAF